METRQLIVALLVAFGVYLLYAHIYARLVPPPPPPAQTDSIPPGPASGNGQTPATGSAPATTPTSAESPRTTLSLTSGTNIEPVTLGGRENDRLRVVLTPIGAAIESIDLTERRRSGAFAYRAAADSADAARVIQPIVDNGRTYTSYLTPRLQFNERPDDSWRLDDLVWSVVESSPDGVRFRTNLIAAGGEPLVQIDKRYTLVPEKPLVLLDLEFTNLSSQPLTAIFTQDGPLGILREHVQYDMRRLMAAAIGNGELNAGSAQSWGPLRDATRAGQPIRLVKPDPGQHVSWTALGEKFFAVYTRPIPLQTDAMGAAWVSHVSGIVHTIHSVQHGSDLVARFTSTQQVLPPTADAPSRFRFEIYAGPKDSDVLKKVNPAFADMQLLGYHLFHGADLRCWCSPLWLTDLMTWILQGLIALMRNGGLAILGIVVIVRTLLHPLSVFQQKSMYRLQEGMARIQPKIDEIKEKYAKDQVRMNQEMMKLYGEEGVNPAAGLVGMVPLFIQLPILGALWTALSTDIHLRHAPLDGWWIRDLSSPDALIPFNPPLPTPFLSWIGVSAIPAFNLLPILMGISMWLQQKYMPKPAMHAKLEAARNAAAQNRKPSSGMTAEDQLRQQRIMAYTMSILMPVMFYAMPSGLNLYWMCTNVFGIAESLIIRRQLEREKQRREQLGETAQPAKKKPGLVGRVFKRLAEQAEELQRKADELSRENKRREDDRKPADKKKRG